MRWPWFFCIVAILGGAACADLEPVSVEDRAPSGDAGATEAGSPCDLCVRAQVPESESCLPSYDECREDSKCGPVIECQFVRTCYTLPSEEVFNCSIPCGLDAGLVSLDDPALALVATFTSCVVEACLDVCGFHPSNLPE